MTASQLDRFVAVRAALARNAAAARLRSRATIAEQDDPGTMIDAAETADAVPIQFHLLYEDDSGHRSQRFVTVRSVERREQDAVLKCFCHLRRAPRSFATNRILEVYDVSTGEVHENASAFFLTHPLLSSPAKPEDHAVQECRDELIVLVVVAACDGLMHEDEEDRLLVHIFDRSPDHFLDEQVVRRHLASIVPDEAAFRSALCRLSRRAPTALAPLLRTLRRLVDADGRLHPDEVSAVVEIEELLGFPISAGVT